MVIPYLYFYFGVLACSESKVSGDSASIEQCAFRDGDSAPCILEGNLWRAASSIGYSVFIAVNAVDPQGYLDITINDNNFFLYSSSGQQMIVEELYCEDVDEGEESLRCVYSFLPAQYPEVDTNNLDNYRATAIFRDWEGNESDETELVIGEALPD